MGLVGRLIWVNNYGKQQCKSLFWRMRAAAKKKQCGSIFGRMRAAGKKQCKFQYDPWSYALNFDDGGDGSSDLRVLEGVGDGAIFGKGGGFVVVHGFSGATAVWFYVYLGV